MGSSLNQIISYLHQWAPPSLAAEWDNVGLQIGDPKAEINSVLITLDVDVATLAYLETHPVDLVITHHPVFFKPLKKIRYDLEMGRIISSFVKNDRHLFSMHTNLDAAENGVNDALIEQYGLDPTLGKPMCEGIGKSFNLDTPQKITTFLNVLPGKLVGHTDLKQVKRVGFCGGAGRSLLGKAYTIGLDLFITGEVGYHDEVSAQFNELGILTLGHKESEVFGLEKIKSKLTTQFSELKVSVYL